MSETSIVINIVDSPEEAPNYNDSDFNGMSFTNAVIVKNGTKGGNPTVDLVFTDAEGRKHVAMATGAIINGIAAALRGVDKNTN